jgi:phosphoglycolate phosphatase
MRRLVLFDIDGTLISTGGRAGKALGDALNEVFGTAGPIDSYSFSGKTDPQIVYELMAAAGLPRADVDARIDEVFEHYLGRLRVVLTPGTVSVLAGVVELLDALEQRPNVTVGLLTGNIKAGATAKLTAAGLSERFRLGAFGSDNEDRNELVPIARQRALDLVAEPFAGERTVVVGDAEADIRCARAGGARAVAVATGWTPAATLAALSPDELLESLASPRALVAILNGAANPRT